MSPTVLRLLRALPPDSGEAAHTFGRELWDPVYAPSWWGRFTGRLQEELLVRAGGADLGWAGRLALGVVLLGAVILAAVVVARVRSQRRAPEAEVHLFDGAVTLTGDDYRAQAEAHLAAGRLPEALLDQYRAVAADGIARGLLTDAPDLTAREVGETLAVTYPAHAEAIRASERWFELVRYGADHGRGIVDAATVQQVADTGTALRHAEPRRDARPSLSAAPR